MAAKSSGRSSAQSGASTECGTAAGRAERLDAHSRHILLNEDGTVSQVALTLLLIQVHALRETNIRDVFIVWDGLCPEIRDFLRRGFLELPTHGVVINFTLPSGVTRSFHLSFDSRKSNKQSCSMREYVTRQTREAVQQFANFLAVHCGESPIFAIVQSLLVSNELLQIVFNVDALQSTLDGRAFLQRQLEHLIKRVGGSSVPISRLFSAHPRPYQQAVRNALLRGISTLGFGFNEGTYKPYVLEQGDVASGAQFFDQLSNVTITPITTTFLMIPTPWPPSSSTLISAAPHSVPGSFGGAPPTKRGKPGGPADMEAAQWLLQLQSPQQQAAHQQRLAQAIQLANLKSNPTISSPLSQLSPTALAAFNAQARLHLAMRALPMSTAATTHHTHAAFAAASGVTQASRMAAGVGVYQPSSAARSSYSSQHIGSNSSTMIRSTIAQGPGAPMTNAGVNLTAMYPSGTGHELPRISFNPTLSGMTVPTVSAALNSHAVTIAHHMQPGADDLSVSLGDTPTIVLPDDAFDDIPPTST